MLKTVVTQEDYDSLPDAIKENYAQLEGEANLFLLKTEPVTIGGKTFALENVAGLRSTLSKQTQKLKTLESQLKAFEGISDPAAAIDAMKRIEELGDFDGDVKEKIEKQVEAIKSQLEQRSAVEIKAAKTALEKEKADHAKTLSLLDSEVLENRLSTALASEGVRSDCISELKLMLKGEARVIREDGRIAVELMDETGSPRITQIGNSTDPMSIVERVQQLKKGSLATLFEATNSQGSGSSTNDKRNRMNTNNGILADDSEAIQNNLDALIKGEKKLIANE